MIKLEKLGVVAGEFRLDDISLEVEEGKYVVLMGRSGSGKTTLLEAICGLRRVVEGKIFLCGREVTRHRPSERGIGFVPQDGALFPNMTVREHLAFALSIRRVDREVIDKRVRECSELLGIDHLLDRYPAGLSGGEIQRVAIGRAISHTPPILCLDEPLSALDAEFHNDMCELLKRVSDVTSVTTLHITHNRAEAEKLADEIYTIQEGKIQKV